MSKEEPTLIEELTWQEVRDTVKNASKELADIIDDISPGKEFTIFKILYPFGTKILEGKTFFIPTSSNSTAPISNPEIDQNIKNKLSYNILPLGLITKNNVELFFDIHRKIFSLALLGKGKELGIWEHFGWNDQYSITSGARSLYMLPKISETLSHKQLKKKFGITDSPPKHLYDHWQVFSQISKSSTFPITWFCEILFLSSRWIEQIKKDNAWARLALYLAEKGWQYSNFGRKKASLDILWEIFVKSLSNKELKFDPYVIDTLKHLIFICTNSIPAIAPSTGDDTTGPLKAIQTIYQDHRGYGLEEYTATIMHPQYFSVNNAEPVYYSLQLPTLLESLPRTKKLTSVIDHVRELSDLITCFLVDHSDIWSNINLGNTHLGQILNNLKLEYFHGDMFAYGDLIKSSSKMPELDPRLKYDPTSDKKRTFASNSSFLRGCVKISTKEPQTTPKP